MGLKAMGMVLLLILLSGCQPDSHSPEESEQEESLSSNPAESTSSEEPTFHSIPVGSFERVAGWLSDEEILYVTHVENRFELNVYNLETEQTRNIRTMDESILEVRIHPDLTRIAVVTSENVLSATIHIFTLTGDIIDELTIESSEMYWDWNSNDPDKLFFSAFYEDWTFDSFVYSSKTKELKRVDTSDPFGKWGSDSALNIIIWQDNDSLTGGNIRQISSDNMAINDFPENNIIYTESFKEFDVTVAISADQLSFIYTLDYGNGQKTATYELPAISNYSQWFIPDIEWMSDGTILTFEADEPGLMDAISTTYSLVSLSAESGKTLHHKGPYQSFACAPSGQSCLVGMQKEELLNMESGERHPWIEVN